MGQSPIQGMDLPQQKQLAAQLSGANLAETHKHHLQIIQFYIYCLK